MWLRLRNVGPLEFPKPTSRQADGDSRSDFQPLRGFLRLTGILLSMVAAFFLSDVVEIQLCCGWAATMMSGPSKSRLMPSRAQNVVDLYVVDRLFLPVNTQSPSVKYATTDSQQDLLHWCRHVVGQPHLA